MKNKLLSILLVLTTYTVQAQPWAQLVKDACPNDDFLQAEFYTFNNKIYYLANHPDYGAELWVSDGTDAGTYMLKDIYPGPDEHGQPHAFTAAGNKLLFRADDATGRYQLFVTDGTETGTQLLKDLQPNELIAFDNKVVFTAKNTTPGADFWITDGTNAGTLMLSAVHEGKIDDTARIGNTLFFTIIDPSYISRLYKTDGTTTNTSQVPNDSNVYNLTPFNSKLAFTTYDPSNYKMNLRICDANGQNATTLASFDNIITGPILYNNMLYFVAYDQAAASADLYSTDGTAMGTTKTLHITNNSMAGPEILIINNKLALHFNDNLWVGDGTEAGTTKLKLLGLIDNIMVHNNKMYFTWKMNELWMTDGTAAGTRALDTSIYVVENSFSQTTFIKANDKLYFEARETFWRDGRKYRNGRSSLYFINANDEVKRVYPYITTQSSVFSHTIMGSDLYLSANDSISGLELWKITDFPTNVQEVSNITHGNTIYPNPVTNTFSIKTHDSKNTTISVYSLTGQLMLQTTELQNINIRHLPAGIYTVHITTGDKTTVEKLLKE